HVAQLRKDLGKLQEQNRQLTQDKFADKRKLDEVQRQMEGVQRELDQERTRLAEGKKEADELRQKANEQEAAAKNALAKTGELQAELTAKDEQISSLQEKLDTTKASTSPGYSGGENNAKMLSAANESAMRQPSSVDIPEISVQGSRRPSVATLPPPRRPSQPEIRTASQLSHLDSIGLSKQHI